MAISPLRLLALATLAAAGLAASARAGELVFPDDVFRLYYFVDVTKPPYSLDNTGKEDDTDKIRAMIQDMWHNGIPALRLKTLYFPDGTYRITDTVDTMATTKQGKPIAVHRLYWLGQSRDKTIFKLDDHLPAFQDPKKPKGILRTESIGTNGNDAYDNSIANITFDVGQGNPGAAGVDYLASNTGEMHDVTIRSGDGAGFAGLLMARQWPGPTFVKNLEVDGFDYGVRLTRMEYSMTFEHLVLKGQHVAAFFNQDNGAFIRDLQSTNTVPAVQNSSAAGLLVLIDSKLSGGDPAKAAIENAGGALVRNVETAGYGQGITNTAKDGSPGAPAGAIAEWTSHPVITNKGFPSSRTTSLNLEVRETPEFEDNDFSHWYSVGNKAKPDAGNADQSDLIQAAIDEAAAQGKTTFYFIPGQYQLAKTVTFHGSIRRVLGFGSEFRAMKGGAFDPSAGESPLPVAPPPRPHPPAPGAIAATPPAPPAPSPAPESPTPSAPAAPPAAEALPSNFASDYGPPVFKVSDVASDCIEFRQIAIQPTADGLYHLLCYGLQQDTDKAVVLRDFGTNGIAPYHSTDKIGDLYLETVVSNGWFFDHAGQKIWARQFDPEGNYEPKIVNAGSKLWILGLKTERPGVQVDTSKGGETEVLGALFYPVRVPGDDPAFRVDNARLSCSYVTIDNSKTPDFPRQLLEIRGTDQQVITPDQTYPRPCFGGGRAALVPLMVAAPADATAANAGH